jgi:hypothetical protein
MTMPSNKYIGYVSGAAIAAGVGAAIAVAGQGTAHADADGSKPASSESKSTATAKDTKSTKKDSPTAGPKRASAKAVSASTVSAQSVKPKFDPAGAIDDLKKQFAGAKTTTADTETATTETASTETASTETAAAAAPETSTTSAVTDLTKKAAETAAVLAKPLANVTSAASTRMAEAAADSTWYVPNNAPVPWDWNPFREGDPIPEGMPEVIWQLEKGVVGLLDPIPFFQPLLREGFEFGYRVSQVIPWVNVVLPLSNIVAQIPDLTSGDPVLFKTATQSIINNLLVTTQPVAILFYGYDQLADIFNVEYEAQGLKDWFYTTAWDVIDFFDILHNPGESGLPLSLTPAGATDNPVETATPTDTSTVALAASYKPAAAATTAASVSAAVATVDDPGSDPLRADDPWPTDMPADVLNTEKTIVGLLPAEIAPIVREAYEAVYRASQIVPVVNLQLPVTEILQAFLTGSGNAVQTTVNQLLLTWQPIALLYYGYDQAMDLANTEDAGYAAKQELYATVWDLIDPTGKFHVLGASGI